MKKKTLVVGSALAVAALSSNVAHADVEAKVAETTATVQQAEAVPVTQEELVAAKAKVQVVETAVKTQEAVVAKAQDDVQAASQAEQAAKEEASKAQALAQEAIPEGIAKAEATIKAEQEQVSYQETQVVNAQSSQTLATDDYSHQEQAVAQAQEAVTKQEAVVEAAKQMLAEKQALLDGTGSQAIIDHAKTTADQLASAKQQVAQAQTGLEQAQKADEKRSGDLGIAEQAVSKAQSNLNNAQSVLTDANTIATGTAKILSEAHAALEKAKSQLSELESVSINYPASYIAALKTYFNNPTEENSAKLDTIAKEARTLAEKNPYHTSEVDKNIVIDDVNHLPENIQEELSVFNAYLINDFRKKMGTDDISFIVNRDMLRLANRVAELSTVEYMHDIDAVQQSAQEFGLVQAGYPMISENIGFDKTFGTLTLADLKQQAYDNIVRMLFVDKASNWGHAINFAGLDRTSILMQYVGVSVKKQSDGSTAMHYLGTDKSIIETLKHSGQTVNIDVTNNVLSVLEDKVSEATAHLSSAQAKYDTAKQADEVAKATQARAQAKYDHDKKILSDVTNKSDRLKASPEQVPAAQSTLVSAQAVLTKAEIADKEAQAAVQILTADVKAKQMALEAAQSDLKEAQEALQPLTAVLGDQKAHLSEKATALETAKTKMVQAQAALTEAKGKLQVAKAHLKALQTAPAQLIKVQEQLKFAQEDLAKAKSEFEKQVKILEELKAQGQAAQTDYQGVMSAYRAYLDKQEQVRLEQEKSAIVRQGGNPIALIDEAGKITGYVDSKKSVATSPKASSLAVQKSSSANKPEKTLPKTGDKQSILAVLGSLFVVSLFGFGKRQKN